MAYTPQDLKIHSDQDTIIIESLLKEGKLKGLKSSNELIAFYGEKLLGTPYVGHTLEGDDEKLVINIEELDCTTFVQTLIALAETTLNNRTSWRNYASFLENNRYRKGEINGYASRLHYTSDWIVDNIARGNIKDVTSSFTRYSAEIKTIDYMTSNREQYPALKSDDNYNKIKNVEIGYRSHKYPLIKKRLLNFKDVKEGFKDGDIVILICKIDGLDASHMGIIKLIKGEPYLLHASSIEKEVVIDKNSLYEMLRISKVNTGVRVLRMYE